MRRQWFAPLRWLRATVNFWVGGSAGTLLLLPEILGGLLFPLRPEGGSSQLSASASLRDRGYCQTKRLGEKTEKHSL